MSGQTKAIRPTGLAICWEAKPDAPARCCTLPPGHLGDHFHEYSGASWPRARPVAVRVR